MSLESPVSVLFDLEGQELAVTASQSASFVDGTQSGLLVMGSSSQGAQFLSLTDDGSLFVTGAVAATFAPNTAVAQGDAGTIAESWYISITDGTQVIGDSSGTPIWVSGTVDIANPVTVNGTVTVDSITNPITIDTTTPLDITGAVDILNPVDVIVSGATFNGDNLLVELSGTNIDANGALLITGSITSTPMKCPATVVTGFDASTTNITVLAANNGRCSALFYMDGNSRAFIKLGAGASSSDYTVELRNNAYFELPANYTGQVDVVFNNNANNTLRITEINEA
jgi:hypothetical protein